MVSPGKEVIPSPNSLAPMPLLLSGAAGAWKNKNTCCRMVSVTLSSPRRCCLLLLVIALLLPLLFLLLPLLVLLLCKQTPRKTKDQLFAPPHTHFMGWGLFIEHFCQVSPSQSFSFSFQRSFLTFVFSRAEARGEIQSLSNGTLSRKTCLCCATFYNIYIQF